MTEHISLSGHFNDGITPQLRVLKSTLGEVNRLHRDMVKLQQQLNRTMEELKSNMDVINKRFRVFRKVVRGAKVEVKGLGEELKGVGNVAIRVGRSLGGVSAGIDRLNNKIRSARGSLRGFRNDLRGLGGLGFGMGLGGRMGLGGGGAFGQLHRNNPLTPVSTDRLVFVPPPSGVAGKGVVPSQPPKRPTPESKQKHKDTRDQWRQHWAHAGGAFGQTLGHTVGNIMSHVMVASFRVGANILGGALRGVWWAIRDGVQDEMSDIQSAGGMFAVDKKNKEDDRLFNNFTQARLFQEETNRQLAHSAATLPGTTAEYVKAAKRITDSIMLAKVNDPEEFRELAKLHGTEKKDNENSQARADITTLLTKFTEQSVLLGLGSSGRGTLSMDMILEQLLTREQISMGQMIRYAPLRDNPVLTAILTENKDRINATKARSAKRLKTVMEVLEEALPVEVINSMRSSLEGVTEAYRSFLIDQDVGLFGLRRELRLMVASTNTYGQYIDENGEVVKDVADAAKVQITVFKLLRDTLAGFAVPLMDVVDLIKELWDPLEVLGQSFVRLREIALGFQQNHALVGNWFKEPDRGFEGKDPLMRSGLASLNLLLRKHGGLDFNTARENILMLENPNSTRQDMAHQFKDLIDQVFTGELGHKIGNLIGNFFAQIFVTLGELVKGISGTVLGSKEKNAFFKGLLDGWNSVTSEWFSSDDGKGRSAASKAIQYLVTRFSSVLTWAIFSAIKNFPLETFMVVFFVGIMPALVAFVGTMLAAVASSGLKMLGGAALTKVGAAVGLQYAAGGASVAAGTVGGATVVSTALLALGKVLVVTVLPWAAVVAGAFAALYAAIKHGPNLMKKMWIGFREFGLHFKKTILQMRLWVAQFTNRGAVEGLKNQIAGIEDQQRVLAYDKKGLSWDSAKQRTRDERTAKSLNPLISKSQIEKQIKKREVNITKLTEQLNQIDDTSSQAWKNKNSELRRAKGYKKRLEGSEEYMVEYETLTRLSIQELQQDLNDAIKSNDGASTTAIGEKIQNLRSNRDIVVSLERMTPEAMKEAIGGMSEKEKEKHITKHGALTDNDLKAILHGQGAFQYDNYSEFRKELDSIFKGLSTYTGKTQDEIKSIYEQVLVKKDEYNLAVTISVNGKEIEITPEMWKGNEIKEQVTADPTSGLNLDTSSGSSNTYLTNAQESLAQKNANAAIRDKRFEAHKDVQGLTQKELNTIVNAPIDRNSPEYLHAHKAEVNKIINSSPKLKPDPHWSRLIEENIATGTDPLPLEHDDGKGKKGWWGRTLDSLFPQWRGVEQENNIGEGEGFLSGRNNATGGGAWLLSAALGGGEAMAHDLRGENIFYGPQITNTDSIAYGPQPFSTGPILDTDGLHLAVPVGKDVKTKSDLPITATSSSTGNKGIPLPLNTPEIIQEQETQGENWLGDIVSTLKDWFVEPPQEDLGGEAMENYNDLISVLLETNKELIAEVIKSSETSSEKLINKQNDLHNSSNDKLSVINDSINQSNADIVEALSNIGSKFEVHINREEERKNNKGNEEKYDSGAEIVNNFYINGEGKNPEDIAEVVIERIRGFMDRLRTSQTS